MAGNRKSQRIEPSFRGSAERDDDFHVGADDRVVGGMDGRKGRGKAAKAGRPRGAPARRRGSSGGIFGLFRRLVYWCLVLGLWGAIGAGGLVLYYGARMPSATSWSIPDRPPNVKILAVSGDIIANRGLTGGEALSLENMSPYIPQAVIAIEDRRFYSHFGVDPLGLARAMLTNITSGRMVQGGSTLTQQLAKNLFLSPERTLERKVQEVLLAFWLEHKYSKDQILAMYLNRVFFGSNSYGVEAASRRYFNKSARDVNLGEAALLAGLLKAPSRLSPARDPEAAEERAQVVLGAMREEGFITDNEIKTAMSQTPARAKSYWSGAEHYAADMVMAQLPGMIGDVTEDLVIDTTIDLDLERKADEAISAMLEKEGAKANASQAALVSIDGTGAIRALVGGRDYAESQFDRASKAKRQPGSAFKPFVYAAALESGRSPLSVRNDAPVRIGKWTPENYDQKYRGEVTLASALANSLNTIAAQLVMEVGPEEVIKLARRLGIESDLQANASIALGTSEVTLVELTAAYAPFMNGGYKATPHIIRRISTADGRVLYENTYDNPPRVLEPDVVSMMNGMMMRVITDGTGKNARIPGWQAAGKTGTTQSFRDALFVGYTSNLTTGVWFGNDDGKSMKKVTGGGLPAKAWSQFMTAAHAGLSPSPLFGTAGGEPVLTGTEPAPEGDQLFDIISRTLGTEERPADNGAAVASGETGTVPLDDGLIPPADVGGERQTGTRRTTLLDVLLGG
ncbi:transglycosylase domain-containing protein [Shinella sp. BYT-45]|uniref:transglycosylase domain-containing protein n=1 Tax=Shinella sp. BYT-45 TaxID=3377377 RepID=UPI00397E9BA5